MLIWLASYPRSGNTFLRVVLKHIFELSTWSIYNDASDIGADPVTSDIVGHAPLPDDFDLEQARAEEKLYLIKTHDYPVNDDDRAIYIVRDGRESVLSYLKYERAYRRPQTTLLDVIYGNVPFGSWSRHLEKWDPKRRNNTLFIRFEELIEMPAAVIEEISAFIGVPPAETEAPSFAELNKVNPRFFSSGKKDSWRNVFSEDEQTAFLLRHYSSMIEYGYTSDLPNTFARAQETMMFRALSRELEYLQNTALRRCATPVEQQASHIEQLRRALGDRTSQVEKLGRQLDSQHSRVQQLTTALSEERAELNRRLATKDAQFDAIRAQLQHVQQQMAHQLQENRGLREQLASADEELATVKRSAKEVLNELQVLRNSRRYRIGDMLVRPYSSIMRRLAK
jgi:hypothetical protein